MDEAALRKANILLVDDVSRNIQILGSILRGEGYSLAFATSGQQALEIVATQHFDMILLDVMMPGMNGLEVCKKLQQNQATAQIPVIFLTAKTGTTDIVEGLEAGAVDYVIKPFNAPELLARVRTHLRLQAAETALRTRTLELEEVNEELRQTLRRLKTLEGILPICMYCKKIRKEGEAPELQSSWSEPEVYIEQHSKALFSHGCCPECMSKHFPQHRRED